METVYSLLAITISVILCFCSITIGFTVMNYGYEAAMVEQHGCELEMTGLPVDEDVIGEKDYWKPGDYRRAQKELEALPQVRTTYLKKGYREYDDAEGNEKKDMYMELFVKAEDSSDLAGCAKQIEKETGYAVRVNAEIATHLGQGSEEDSMAQAAGKAIVAMIGALFASFVLLVIRNTMMLPVLERMKEYGVLRCVGMSKGQISFMLAVEGVFLTLISTVLGTGIGMGLLRSCQGWVNDCLMLDVPARFHFYPSAVLYSCLLCIGVTLLALMEPARQAGNRSVQDTLRGGVYGLRAGRGGQKGKHHISHFLGRIFGVEWEYAARNMTRNPGSQVYLFLGLVISMALLTAVFSGVSSMYATEENSMQGNHMEYQEGILLQGKSTQKEKEQICREVSGLSGMKETGILRLGGLYLSGRSFLKHYLDPEKSTKWNWSQWDWDLAAVGYDKEHMKGLEKQLVAGSLDYDRMVQERGVLLCDYQYNQKDENGNYTKEDARRTDYKPGDKLTILTNEAHNRVVTLVQGLEKSVGKEPAYVDPDTEKNAEKLQKSEKKRKSYWKKVRVFLREKGYPVGKYEDVIGHWEKTSGGESYYIHLLVEQMEADLGNVVTFPIMGIIKEDVYNSAYLSQKWLSNGSGVGVVMADQTYDVYSSDIYGDNLEKDILGKGAVYVGFKRDIRKSTAALSTYIKNHNEKASSVKYSYVKDGGDGSLEWNDIGVDNRAREIELLEKGGIGVAGFILMICLLQIFNVTAAGMTMRRNEFYLLSVAGMTRGQMQKMIILEKAATCLAGILTGIGTGYGLSYLFVKVLLDQDGGLAEESGGICFVCPWGKLLILAGIIYGLCLLCSRGKQRKVQ